MNDTDPPLSLPNDQCVNAVNVEWVVSMLGERRRGSTGVTLTADLTARDRIPFVYRHLPTSDETASELFALGVTGTSTAMFCRKTTSWSTITPTDAFTISGSYQYQLQAQSLHGKMFVAYKSAVNRLHVWDGTTLRRAGLAAPTAAPTGANTGSGSFASTRYYRVREAVLSGSTVLLRSEPGPVLTFAPSGSGTGVVVTKPADMGESATHWELEASLSETGDYYRIARTVVGTGSVTDSVAATTGYAASGTLSEERGDYTPIHSGKFLLVDEDRLLVLGSHDDDTLASRMAWTPVYNDTGEGNDERIPLSPVSFRDLDTFKGGAITGAVGPVNGEIWIFKWSHIYKAMRTGVRTNAYDIVPISTQRGALPGSMVEGVDQQGSPCVYFLDPKVGPCRIGSDGIVRRCGRDIWTTWQTVNINAASVISRAIFYDSVGQVHWFVATNGSDTPNKRLVLHVEHTRDTEDGVRGGWAVWDGPSAAVISTCLYSTNIDANTARNLTLVPFVGLATTPVVLRTDTGTTDNGTAFTPLLKTKPYTPINILHQFEVKGASLLGTATTNALVDITVTPDFGKQTALTVTGVDLTPAGSETDVIQHREDLGFAELTVVDFTFADSATNAARWELNQFALKDSKGQTR